MKLRAVQYDAIRLPGMFRVYVEDNGEWRPLNEQDVQLDTHAFILSFVSDLGYDVDEDTIGVGGDPSLLFVRPMMVGGAWKLTPTSSARS